MTSCNIAALTGIIVQVIGDAGAACGIDAGAALEIASITMDGAAAQTLTIDDTAALTLTAGANVFDVGASTLIILADLTTTGGSLTITGAGNTTFSGDLIGTQALIKSGAGKLTLDTAVKTTTGDITLTAGTLESDFTDVIDAAGTLTLDGGIFLITTAYGTDDWPTAIAIGACTPVIEVNAASVCNEIIAAGGNSYSITGTAELELTVANTGSGTITVNDANVVLKLSVAGAHAGPLTVTAGKVISNDAAALGTYTTLTLTAGTCLLYTSPSPRDATLSRMPSSA